MAHTPLASITVEPLNKGHIGDNINSAVVSFVERLSSFGGSKCIRTTGKQFFGTLTYVLCREVLYRVPISEGPLSDCNPINQKIYGIKLNIK